MLFNSIRFLFFLPIVVFLYYIFPPKIRWFLLLGASYIFLVSWKPEYILLILISTLVTYFSAKRIEDREESSVRRRYLWLSMSINIGMLVLFKYINFINENIRALWHIFGKNYPLPDLHLPTPLGISFYTLLILGYLFDVYNRRINAERHIGIFALFVSFFPQLAAGPIERGKNMLTQFKMAHYFDSEQITGGLLRIGWGFFKKLVVADRLGLLVNTVYDNPTQYTGNPLILATVAFSLQIYCDFSAYSDIAIGVAQLLDIKLMENFQQPYFSKSISEFWRRWHISLSSWFRDYFFYPLRRSILNTDNSRSDSLTTVILPAMITMVLSGLWHGANWTFVIWGGVLGLLIVLDVVWGRYIKSRTHLDKLPEFIKGGLGILITFSMISFSWVFFRANSLADALYILRNMFVNVSFRTFGIGYIMPGGRYELIIAVLAIAIVILVDILQVRQISLRSFTFRLPFWVRWPAYYAFIFIILIFGKFGLAEFIYIQF